MSCMPATKKKANKPTICACVSGFLNKMAGVLVILSVISFTPTFIRARPVLNSTTVQHKINKTSIYFSTCTFDWKESMTISLSSH